MGFGTVILVALVPCCILLLEVVFEKVIGWICQQGPPRPLKLTVRWELTRTTAPFQIAQKKIQFPIEPI